MRQKPTPLAMLFSISGMENKTQPLEKMRIGGMLFQVLFTDKINLISDHAGVGPVGANRGKVRFFRAPVIFNLSSCMPRRSSSGLTTAGAIIKPLSNSNLPLPST